MLSQSASAVVMEWGRRMLFNLTIGGLLSYDQKFNHIVMLDAPHHKTLVLLQK